MAEVASMLKLEGSGQVGAGWRGRNVPCKGKSMARTPGVEVTACLRK